MTHSPEVQALIDAFDKLAMVITSTESTAADAALFAAREKLRPKPAKPREFWLVKQDIFTDESLARNYSHSLDNQYETIRVREVMPDEPAWRIPTWEQVPKNKLGSHFISEKFLYGGEEFTAFVNSLMKVKP